MSEFDEEVPFLTSLDDVFGYIRAKAKASCRRGTGSSCDFAFPTRLKEGRFPTLAELDAAAPSTRCCTTRGRRAWSTRWPCRSPRSPNPRQPVQRVIVKDPKTGELTGMLRNATGVLRGVPGSKASGADRRAAVKKLFGLYNSRGITSIADRNSSRGAFDCTTTCSPRTNWTVRIVVCPGFSPYGSREEIARRFDNLPGKDGKVRPDGRRRRLDPHRADQVLPRRRHAQRHRYMRTPWPKGRRTRSSRTITAAVVRAGRAGEGAVRGRRRSASGR